MDRELILKFGKAIRKQFSYVNYTKRLNLFDCDVIVWNDRNFSSVVWREDLDKEGLDCESLKVLVFDWLAENNVFVKPVADVDDKYTGEYILVIYGKPKIKVSGNGLLEAGMKAAIEKGRQ